MGGHAIRGRLPFNMKKQMRTYVDGDGRQQITLAFSEKIEDELCDFCSTLNPPYKEYACKDFGIPGTDIYSRNGWNACLTCAALIDANDRDGLVERSSLMLALETGDYRIETMRELHNLFFDNRIYDNENKS